ncbi:MAG: diguanylate cyclase [Pyrinomonadaceae bacterium]|nr:diguanylate cyclase [Pyrinomonadaceae bacterium]
MSAEDNNQSRNTWPERQRVLAESSGLAVSIFDRDGLTPRIETNNNSICAVLSRNPDFAPECARYCGRVHSQSEKTGQPFKFKCHAGLECIAVPIKIEGRKSAVAVVGRAFTKAEDYREATEEAISGSWSNLAPSAVFENILLAGSQALELLAKKFTDLKGEDIAGLSKVLEKAPVHKKQSSTKAPAESVKERPETKTEPAPSGHIKEATADQEDGQRPLLRLAKINEFGAGIENEADRNESADAERKEADRAEISFKADKVESTDEKAEWRGLFEDILDLDYGGACKLILEFVNKQFGISSMAWLENHNNRLSTAYASGDLKNQKIQISVAMNDPRMRKLLKEELSIELREKNPVSETGTPESIRLFPIIVGGVIRSALVIGERANDKKVVESIQRFCKTLPSELEILRLRDELNRKSWLDIAFRKFTESLKMIDTDDFWLRLMQNTAELLRAERGSLLIYDEKAGKLIVKAAIGRKADVLKSEVDDIGMRIAKGVWEKGEALVIRNISKSSIKPAPAEWNYKTGSFISYPLVIGERKIGVLNLADRADGGEYVEKDVQLLHHVVPHIAVAADRASLKSKAGEFEQLSVTDPLTGLLNRRYLEERLDEEIKRSARHGYPMSFMMIDVDDFKSYNDQFLHPEGDKALKIVGHCLRETLRGADVAARYGGEEFSILLPQTTLEEAETIAERIRSSIESAEFPHRQVTVSIGIATLAGSIDSVEKLVECADKALFKAKKEGKNQVIVFNGDSSGLPVSIH